MNNTDKLVQDVDRCVNEKQNSDVGEGGKEHRASPSSESAIIPELSATPAPYTVGQQVVLLKDIWDDGADHHPPGCLARKGEVLIVRKNDPGHEFPVCVSHEEIIDRSFRVALGEIALANGQVTSDESGTQ